MPLRKLIIQFSFNKLWDAELVGINPDANFSIICAKNELRTDFFLAQCRLFLLKYRKYRLPYLVLIL